MRYDDGFIAYINGTEIPAPPKTRPASRPRGTRRPRARSHTDARGDRLRGHRHLRLHRALMPGNNVLAIHGLNATAELHRFPDQPLADGRRDRSGRRSASWPRRRPARRTARARWASSPTPTSPSIAGSTTRRSTSRSPPRPPGADPLHARRHRADGDHRHRLHRPDQHQHDQDAPRRGVQDRLDADRRRHADVHLPRPRDPAERRRSARSCRRGAATGRTGRWIRTSSTTRPTPARSRTISRRCRRVAGDAVERLVRRGRAGDLHLRLRRRARGLDGADLAQRHQHRVSDRRGARDPGQLQHDPLEQRQALDRRDVQGAVRADQARCAALHAPDVRPGRDHEFDTLILDAVYDESWMASSSAASRCARSSSRTR